MARPQLGFDVEYAEIMIAGVWYTVEEVNKLMNNLDEIMKPRNWRDTSV